jgi:PPOX class probable F420-dependent enzyme
MPEMNNGELFAFLQRPLIAVLTTVRPDGSLHSTPVWFEYEQGVFYFWVGSDSMKARNIRLTSEVSACIATQEEPYQYVSMDGACEIKTAGIRERCLSICRRYYTEEAAQAFVEADLLAGDSAILAMIPRRLMSERSA